MFGDRRWGIVGCWGSACALLVFGGIQALAASLYTASWTGADLLTDSNVQLTSARTKTQVGTSLQFGTGAVSFEKLVEVAMVPAGSVPTNEPVFVRFTIDEVPPPGSPVDHDLYVGVSDGTRFVSFARADNNGGGAYYFQGLDGNGAVTNGGSGLLLGNLGFSSEFGALFTLDSSVQVDGTIGTTSVPQHTYTTTIDRAGGLRFVVIAGDLTESYQINSLSVSVFTADVAVPEPTSLWCICVSVLFGVFFRTRTAAL